MLCSEFVALWVSCPLAFLLCGSLRRACVWLVLCGWCFAYCFVCLFVVRTCVRTALVHCVWVSPAPCPPTQEEQDRYHNKNKPTTNQTCQPARPHTHAKQRKTKGKAGIRERKARAKRALFSALDSSYLEPGLKWEMHTSYSFRVWKILRDPSQV